ncbi:bifunctional (p)ppGpp synthetase/guanosine-3',5'-bis(diphosphate) 3'-pyrophosphohydrolase [Helicobacter jaachi]|uniref:Bifunctional (P)ppGpp synthetase/guanosine-3',5'-bis(Diphosphate) 3'-pyrophosphohydrolase n=1 Tax=Helicobacter jaachi TaxID=1677920 RepID=A0A4U8TCH3_9HELI|nr:RelA/SpoT family protein [Helicobacter jaachi]TLD96948.1 bifunctional (p)ppGpp synthetase/guanosine-3',5'-bis(diphosphate) 3'-pyrophosphohydrolase [Helicobacter jaachi]
MDFFAQIAQINNIESAIAKLQTFTHITPKVQKAIDVAINAHNGQLRKSGIPYVVHPLCVACIVAFYGGDETMICAALLHDVVEDTYYSLEDVRREFDWDTGHLVDALTKIVEIRKEELSSNLNEKLAASALSFRKMLLASVKDIRALVIKISDRMHNMLTLSALPPHKQKRIAEETLMVYAPIAHRLGISSLKSELEDRSFFYIFPEEYRKIEQYMKENNQSITLRLNEFRQKVATILLQNGFNEKDFTIESRVKRYYSIFLKMQRKGVGIDEILDLLAVRVIVPTSLECYKVLGLLHLQLKPVISRLKDYIALPKENGYQTIHTTIFEGASIYEVQIRTFDMHKSAQYGVAAHWKYKSGGLEPNLEWLNNLQYQNDTIEEFYELAKNDLYKEDMMVFSPAGDIYNLPVGAVALDFAYAVHSDIGNNAKEAFINHQNASLLQPLKNGDIVRIVVAEPYEKIHPRCTWIDAVKTSRAKNHMRIQCQAKLKEINKKVALQILQTIFDSSQHAVLTYLKENRLESNIQRAAYDLAFLKEVKNSIKGNFLREANFLGKIKINMLKLKALNFDNIIVQTNRNVNEVIFDYCCHPKYGDDILAIKTSQKAYIHHKMCERALNEIDQGSEMLFVQWANEQKSMYKVIIALENQKGTLALLSSLLAKLDCNILKVDYNTLDRQFSTYCEICFESKSQDAKTIKEALNKKYKIIEFSNLKDVYLA